MIDIAGKGNMAAHYREILSEYSKINESPNKDMIIAIPFFLHETYLSSAETNRLLIEKPAVTTRKGIEILKNKCVYVGHILRFFETTEFVRDLLNETQAVVYEIDIKRYTNKEKKDWWYKCNDFLFWYEVIHSMDLIDYVFPIKDFEWREKRLNMNNELLIGVKSGFVVNGVKGRLNHFMESSYEENKFTLKTSIGNIEIINYERVYVNGKLEVNLNFEEEFNKALREQVKSFVFKTPKLERISWENLEHIYEIMLEF
ncbi:hypothetical protein PDK26_17355 [Bacillus cereus]|nr:hypothetical protein [Bacillus cereus]MDA1612987.1 hypothetical protein [Bacillus cereus]